MARFLLFEEGGEEEDAGGGGSSLLLGGDFLSYDSGENVDPVHQAKLRETHEHPADDILPCSPFRSILRRANSMGSIYSDSLPS